MCIAAAENARRASLVGVLGTDSSWASDDHRGQTRTSVWMRPLGYAGIEDDNTLNVACRLPVYDAVPLPGLSVSAVSQT